MRRAAALRVNGRDPTESDHGDERDREPPSRLSRVGGASPPHFFSFFFAANSL